MVRRWRLRLVLGGAAAALLLPSLRLAAVAASNTPTAATGPTCAPGRASRPMEPSRPGAAK
ncbi:hypothetical protein, partial [Cyanobium sp. Lug-B]|uniref:hypothetical protein n=1 Tax=Cyanobium sp. Lug-B TaxID=2823716 RepID=UPI0020CE2E78